MKSIDLDQLPVILRKARQALDLTQEDVAKKLGITQRAYAFYEDEERKKIPKAKRLADLGKILNIPVQSLLKYYNAEIEAETSKSEVEKAIPKGLEKEIKDIGQHLEKVVTTAPRSDHAAYIKLLEENDRFFKTEYHSLLLSLNKLMEIGMRSEELIKLNLEHIGNVEAMQKGVDPGDVHEQINNQIAGIEGD